MSPLESKLRHMALGAGPTIECTQAADRIAELEKELEIAQEQAFRIAELEIERDSAWVGLRQLKTANDSLKAENKAFRSDPTKGWCEYEHEIAGLKAELKWLQREHVRVCSGESSLQAELEALKKAAQWTPVGLPPELGRWVLVTDGVNLYSNAKRIINIADEYCWVEQNPFSTEWRDCEWSDDITHWMPLPKPPALLEQK